MKDQSRLKKLREEHNLTQEELSKAAHIRRQSISNWEIDFSSIGINNAIKLADFFHVTLDYLVGRDFEKTNKEQLVALLKNVDASKLVDLLIEAKKEN